MEDDFEALCLSSAPLDGCKIVLNEPGVYAITINPSDLYQFFTEVQNTHGANKRLAKFTASYDELMKKVFKGYDTVHVIEISEPITGKCGDPKNARPRLHSHGLIYFKNLECILHFLLNVAPELAAFCSYSVKRITDMDKWETYCHKHQFLGFDIVTTGHVIHKNPKRATKKELWWHCAIHYNIASSPSNTVPLEGVQSETGGTESSLARPEPPAVSRVEDIPERTRKTRYRVRKQKSK
ncbi:hypothetical protein [Rheinheimera sp.]|uniref:hypothetical protein n=1 Tax=Rheinheimera sp. TaxID=1869214 RepID=UPI004047D310